MLQPFFTTTAIEAGCDEVGRGCLAGDVYAAAVILPRDFNNQWVTDSKKLSEKKRNELREVIENTAAAWAIGIATIAEIDEINILNASYLAMHRAIEQLDITPELLLIDGNRFKPYLGIPHQCVIKGDGIYTSIAAASILAKTHRDAYMEKIALEYPDYDWRNNKGYPTKKHRTALTQFGATPYHRQSFKWNAV